MVRKLFLRKCYKQHMVTRISTLGILKPEARRWPVRGQLELFRETLSQQKIKKKKIIKWKKSKRKGKERLWLIFFPNGHFLLLLIPDYIITRFLYLTTWLLYLVSSFSCHRGKNKAKQQQSQTDTVAHACNPIALWGRTHFGVYILKDRVF